MKSITVPSTTGEVLEFMREHVRCLDNAQRLNEEGEAEAYDVQMNICVDQRTQMYQAVSVEPSPWLKLLHEYVKKEMAGEAETSPV